MKKSGYSRVCGDCIDFCSWMPGETNEYYVNSYITTCFDVARLKKKATVRQLNVIDEDGHQGGNEDGVYRELRFRGSSSSRGHAQSEAFAGVQGTELRREKFKVSSKVQYVPLPSLYLSRRCLLYFLLQEFLDGLVSFDEDNEDETELSPKPEDALSREK